MPYSKRIAFVLCCSMTLFLSPKSDTFAADETPVSFLSNGITAHRGNSAEYPENTMPAFQSALQVGVDWIELDIFRTRDGEIVVTHDATTGRVAGKNLVIADSTYEELKELDVATDFRNRNQLSLKSCPKETMPTLFDVLQLIMSQEKTRVSIQPKSDCVAEAVALVQSLEADKWVGFNDGNLNYMKQVKELAPHLIVFWDRGPQTNLAEEIKIANEFGFEALVLRHDGVTTEKVQQIQNADIEAGAWTANSDADLKRLLLAGVDRIYTDRPAAALQLKTQLQKSGQLKPRP
ncbi:glycerophosphodiester phosphodiesterase [Planctomicrobium sp. SH527]|uniref:glycerophosphodiester phosphodiesterase n=1 Tax=Planctomicrobium sp. SH527 TaxID=3448123 RepID=UPI003F5B96B4